MESLPLLQPNQSSQARGSPETLTGTTIFKIFGVQTVLGGQNATS